MRGLIVVCSLALAGCPVGSSQLSPPAPLPPNPQLPDDPDPPGDPALDVPAAARLVIGQSLGETLATLDLRVEPPILAGDVAPTGQSPNAMVLDGERLVLVNSLSNALQVLDAATLATLHEWSTGAGTNPFDLTVVEGIAYVTLWRTGEVLGIDLETGAGRGRLALPDDSRLPRDVGITRTTPRPEGIAATADGSALWVALTNLSPIFVPGGPGVVVEIDRESDSLTEATMLVLTEGRNAADVERTTIAGEQRLVVSCAGDIDQSTGHFAENGALVLIDPVAATEVESLAVASAPIEVLLLGARAFAASAESGEILVVNLESGLTERMLTLPDNGLGLSFCSGLAFGDSETLFALEFNGDRLYEIAWQAGTITRGWTVGDGPDVLLAIPEDD